MAGTASRLFSGIMWSRLDSCSVICWPRSHCSDCWSDRAAMSSCSSLHIRPMVTMVKNEPHHEIHHFPVIRDAYWPPWIIELAAGSHGCISGYGYFSLSQTRLQCTWIQLKLDTGLASDPQLIIPWHQRCDEGMMVWLSISLSPLSCSRSEAVTQ